MHPNAIFRKATSAANLQFARARGFGVLAVSTDGAPLLSHVPFIVSEDGATLDLHLVRSNPIVRRLMSRTIDARSIHGRTIDASIAVSGPDAYISPDWYAATDQVPTWNYVAVHLTGLLEMRPAEELHNLLARQSNVFETQLAPKPPWTIGKMTPDALDKMMRMIVPVRLTLVGVDGTWKLSQNKPDDMRERAAHSLQALGSKDIAALMLGISDSAP
jgi:transcriptional regulator